MSKIWLLFLFLWIVGKAFSSLLEEMQARKRRQQSQNDPGGTFQQKPVRKAPRPARLPQRPAQTTAASVPAPEQNELERLLREAMARKRHAQVPPASARQPIDPVAAEQRRIEAARTAPALGRAEGIPELQEVDYRQPVRRQHSVPERVAVPREREQARAPVPAQAQMSARVHAPGSARKTAAAVRQRRRKEAPVPISAACSGLLGRFDIYQARRGIMLAEILGQPKGLRDIINFEPDIPGH